MTPAHQNLLTTDLETYILLVKGNIGPGCLSLPFCFSLLGPVWSLPMLAVTGFFCVFNMWVLIECKNKVPGLSTYGELGMYAFGKSGERLVEFLLMTMQLSICTVYFSFMGDSLGPILNITSQYATFLTLLPVLLLTQIRHMRHLVPLSLTAFVLVVTAMGAVLCLCIFRLHADEPLPAPPVFRQSQLVPFFASVVYCFEGIGIILPIENSMQNQQRFPHILTYAMITVSIVYVVFAELVVTAFGEVTDASVTGFLEMNPAVSGQFSRAVALAVGIAVFFSYPLQLYPALQVLELYCGFGKELQTPPPSTSLTPPALCCVVTQRLVCCNCIEYCVEELSFADGRVRHGAIYSSPEYKRRPTRAIKAARRRQHHIQPLMVYSPGRAHTSVCSSAESSPLLDMEVGSDYSDSSSFYVQNASAVSSWTGEDMSRCRKCPSDETYLPRKPSYVTEQLAFDRASGGHRQRQSVLWHSVSAPPGAAISSVQVQARRSFDTLQNTSAVELCPTKLPLQRNRSSSEGDLFVVAEVGCKVQPGRHIVVSQYDDEWDGENAGVSRVFAFFPRSSVRVVVVLCSAAIAMLVPNVGLLVSLAGASSGAALSLVCPSLIMLVLPDYDDTPAFLSRPVKMALCVVSILLGFVGAVAGTWVAVCDIWNVYS